MFDNKRYEKINKNLCKIMDTDLDAIGFAFCYDEEKAMEIPDMYEFCKWWVRKYPDKFAKLKGTLYQFRENRAKTFRSISALIEVSNKGQNKLSPLTIFQIQMLTNNCIDQTNSTCQLVQMIIKMCEKILRGE